MGKYVMKAATFILFGLLLIVVELETKLLPQDSCYLGTYKVPLPPFDSCSGFRKCDLGYYCVDGERFQCPAGTFGASKGLNTSECSGKCSPGFYCPLGSTIDTAQFCGNSSMYCPEGSSLPSTAPQGYYTVDDNGIDGPESVKSRSQIELCPRGHSCRAGERFPCRAGSYGNTMGLSSLDPFLDSTTIETNQENCTGLCPEGWYCPAASTQPFEHSCGSSPVVYCPEGSSRPQETAEGYYAIRPHLNEGGGYGAQLICPRGSYCLEGIRYDCPAGHYGAIKREINSSCSGFCDAGYYCPPGSSTSKQIQCDFTDRYCPEGSEAPMPVTLGYYTVGVAFINASSALEMTVIGENIFQEQAPVTQSICEPGFYCPADGVKRPCPLGRYGDSYGLSSPECSGWCAAGYFCPEGAPVDKQFFCGGSDKFCPPGSAVPQIANTGYYTVGGDERNRTAERRCEPGFYCQHGVKHVCDAGYWGGIFGLNESTCSGPCSPGYYCPLGSISATEIMCGDPNKYCPGGDYKPTVVSPGYYSVGGNDSTRSGQEIAPVGHYAFNGLLYVCPAGYYGATTGLQTATCSGACNIPGYYCPTGSVSPLMRFCGGDNVFCPPRTVAPIKVHTGFYTADYLYETCPPGMWRDLSIPQRQATPNDDTAIVTAHPLRDCQLCPEGTYKSVSGDDVSLCLACEPIQSVSTADRIMCQCLTVREEGYTSYFNITGSNPTPSSGDLRASSGSSTGYCQRVSVQDISYIDASMWDTNTALTRYQQWPCDPGHYCVNGLRYKCPKGYYGTLPEETRPLCEGLCLQGYFCLQSSTSPTSYPCGDAKYICPTGSFEPTLVPPGYYSNEDVPEELRYYQTICPKGYYCPGDGRRYRCSPGTFTDQEGTIDAQCMGVCDRGHYCEEGSPSRTQFQCGNSSVYCPRGSPFPLLVNDGFYGVFSGPNAGEQGFWDSLNATYSLEIPCEPGYYCQNGIKYPCPPGTYGWRYGITSSTCDGKCARGYYCPSYMQPRPDAPSYTIWPGAPHTAAAELECGDVEYYCPLGSSYPTRVSGGYYSIGGSSHNRTRYAQTICPAGSYCEGAIPYLCPAKYYGITDGLSDSTCTASCPSEFYCPPGTVEPLQCPETQYSTGFQSVCSECPGGRTTPLPCQNEKGCCFR